MENKEILLTSESSGQLWNSCVWDFTTGTSLSSVKGGKCSSRHTLSTIANDYLISAEIGTPIINIWSYQRKDQPQLKIVTPGKIGALTVTPCGTFCIASVAEKIHIWQISNGDLVTVLTHHYQPVTCLKTTDDGSFFISAGEDNLVFVYRLSKMLSMSSVGKTPDYTWSHHSLPVTDVYVGKGGRRARVATVSLDRTLRLYSLRSGQLLLTVIMEVSLMSVTMDASAFFLFAGGNDGRIFQVNLMDPPSTVECNFASSSYMENVFSGHSKAVTCLTLSMDGQSLISGSDDHSVKIWDIPSKQCLRSLNHKGPITNTMLIFGMNMHLPPTVSVQNFSSHLYGSDNLDGFLEQKTCAFIQPQWQHKFSENFEEAKSLLLRDETDNLTQIVELQKLNELLYENTVHKALVT